MMTRESLVVRFLKYLYFYVAGMVFVLWISGVIESFVPVDSEWLTITLQALFVVKITCIVGLLLVPLLVFIRTLIGIGIGLLTVLIILIAVLIASDVARLKPILDNDDISSISR